MRIFTALDLDDNLAHTLYLQRLEFVQSLPWNVKIVPPENYHITLHYMGELTPREAEIVAHILSQADRFSSFDFTTGGPGNFVNRGIPKVIFEEINRGKKECKMIHRELTALLEEESFLVESRKYRPHITLCRISQSAKSNRRGIEEDFPIKNMGLLQPLQGWVKSLSLYQSQLTKNGPIYRRLHQVFLLPKPQGNSSSSA